MKALGIKQFHQKTFKLLPHTDKDFANTLGSITKQFMLVVFGYSGNGKTEFCVKLAKYLAGYGRVAWLSYEQRHGYDLQRATVRNKMEEVSGNFIPIDPLANVKKGVSLFEDLVVYLDKRGSPEFVFIDSIDYTGFTFEDYKTLKEKFEHKTAFIFIAHADKSGNLKKTVSRDVMFDGGVGIRVKDYIAEPEKNRYGGFDPYIIYEEKARERNPMFFTQRLKAQTQLPLAGAVDATPAPKSEGNLQIPPPETEGVNAENTPKATRKKSDKTPVEA